MIPRIAVTTGEPAGIGPELCATLAGGRPDAELVLIGNRELIESAARHQRIPFDVADYASDSDEPQPARTRLIDVALPVRASPGQLDARNAPYVLELIDRAVTGCESGEFHGLTTAPLHKGIINDAGHNFSGHTEYLADRCGVDRVVMMLIADRLRVALATTHLPLRDVPDAIDRRSLETTLRIVADDLRRRFGIERPRVLVCGLNPHAGEGGHLGHEDDAIIAPVVEQLDGDGMTLRGPLPADTAFTPRALEGADAVLAMYHDQGLPVLKYAGFGSAVNVTLGLPIVRTSVDHGTALDIAGSGIADAGSLTAAIDLAVRMARR